MAGYDDLLLRVEERAPGFGGMFLDSDGRLAIYLLEPSQLAAACDAIETVFGRGRIPSAGTRVLQGQYVVSQLKQWTEAATALLELPGVSAVDLDEAENRVAIGIEDEYRRQAVEAALSSLDIPRGAVAIEVIGGIQAIRSDE